MNQSEPSNLLFAGFSESDFQKIDQAIHILDQAPSDVNNFRPRGIDVAIILHELSHDIDTILAALLSDSRIESTLEHSRIIETFGEPVSNLVKEVHALNKTTIYTLEMSNHPSQTEILRKMLLAMTHDVRSVLIKLAYRIQRLKNLPKESYEIRRFIAKETLDIFAPLANRLGVYQYKWQLEDLAFRYLDPQNYRKIAKSLAENRTDRETSIKRFIESFKNQLTDNEITAKVYGRPKHIYSIWNKMRRKKLPVEELYDLLAVRVLVDTLANCYSVLGIAHSNWQYVPKEFDDYIANPKENGYQSLHTVILDPDGNRIEIQIRTQAMHDFAELGVAAHWLYKEGSKHNSATEKSIAALRQLLENKDDQDNLIENFHTELFSDRVFVLTPAGKLVDLIKGSTPLDFAYSIHTEVGHSCRGAKVNGQIKPLTYRLRSGDRVEILTVQNGKPNYNWIDSSLGYLKSSRAINKVKSWFRQQQEAEKMALGKSILDREIKRLGLKDFSMTELLKHFKLHNQDQLLNALGRGDINQKQLVSALQIPEFELNVKKPIPSASKSQSAIIVAGINNVLTSLAGCCKPIPGEEIMGYISHKKGITIHQKNCATIQSLAPDQQGKLITAEWNTGQPVKHTVNIIIHAYNAQNLLSDVSHIFAQSHIHINNASLKTHPDLSAILTLTIQIENTAQLSQVLNKIGQLPSVIDVKRKV